MIRWSAVGFAGLALSLGCSGAPPDNGGDPLAPEDVGQVKAELTLVQPGVLCVQVSVIEASFGGGAPTVVAQSFAATPGAAWSGTVPLGSFSRGSVQVNANAYNVACASIATATPTWVADPISLAITPGIPGAAPLNFRQNFGVVATGNFAPSVTDVVTSEGTTGLLLADGTVRMVGFVPQPNGLTGVAELAVGSGHACVRKTDGTMWCWGKNANGEFGNGTTSTAVAVTAVQVPLAGVRTIAAGDQTTCASTATLTYCWGYNGFGGVDGTGINRLSPQPIFENSSKISTTNTHSCGIRFDGALVCWGTNTSGEIGLGTTSTTLKIPSLVSNLPFSMVDVSVGVSHTCAIDAQNGAFCWGNNANGQLGVGTTTSAVLPKLVGLSGSGLIKFTEIEAGQASTCGRTTLGAVNCWGAGVGVGAGWAGPYLDVSNETLPSAKHVTMHDGSSACAVLLDDSVWCWGANDFGQLGDLTTIYRYKPVPWQI